MENKKPRLAQIYLRVSSNIVNLSSPLLLEADKKLDSAANHLKLKK